MPSEIDVLQLDDVLTWSAGKLLNRAHDSFDFIGTDSRVNLKDKLFIPLRGDLFDGHMFIKAAIENGCSGIIFDRKSNPKIAIDPNSHVTHIEVDDTLLALQAIAHGYRRKLNKTILAITGSAGKTTTKEFTHQILSKIKKTYANQGSLNNHWGVPFSLLSMRQADQFGVIEMGMSNYGEIQRLVEIAQPDIVVCTMVGLAHFEHFGSHENIAKAKNEIYKFSKKNAIRIFNLDDPHVKKMRDDFIASNTKESTLSFSEVQRSADVFMQIKSISSQGLQLEGQIMGKEGRALVSVFGRHNLTNILAATALAAASGMSPNLIWSSLGTLKTNWGRNQLLKADGGAQIIFDGYNANPDSMESLVENIAETPVTGRRILILGEMLELGENKGQFHFELGQKIRDKEFDQVIFYGPSWQQFKSAFSAGTNRTQVWASEKMDEKIIYEVSSNFKSGDLVAIKGSRGMKTEKVVSMLVQAFSHEKI